MTYTTRLIGHLVWIAAVVSETCGTILPPVHANSVPPATAIADRSRKRRREIGSGWLARRSSSIGPVSSQSLDPDPESRP